MESLAVLASLVMLSVMCCGAVAAAAAYSGSTWGAPIGLLSVAAGAWWWSTLPHGVPVLALVNIACGLWAIMRAIR